MPCKHDVSTLVKCGECDFERGKEMTKSARSVAEEILSHGLLVFTESRRSHYINVFEEIIKKDRIEYANQKLKEAVELFKKAYRSECVYGNTIDGILKLKEPTK